MIDKIKQVILVVFLFSIIILQSCRTKLQLGKVNPVLYPIDKTQAPDLAVLIYSRPYRLKLDSMLSQTVAVSTIEITKARPVGTLNNLEADAIYATARSQNIPFDLVYNSYNGIKASMTLPKGNIPLSKIFELVPYENLVTTVTFTGADLQKFFDRMAANGGDLIAGASYKIKNGTATNIRIGDKPFDTSKSYTVLTSDYLANGGEGGEIFLKATDKKVYNLKIRDAILIYLQEQQKAGKVLNPQIDGRIIIE